MLRFPVFVTGIALTLMGTYQVIDGYFIAEDNKNLSDGVNKIKMGLGWLSMASSVYLKY